MRHLHRSWFTALLSVGMCAVTAHAARAQESPYVDYGQRQIKALSTRQTEDYLEGRGMGFALAAELNGYPGPRHVLQLADSLGLDAAQRASTAKLFAQMRGDAQRLGATIVRKEAELDSLFAHRGITPERLRTLTAELGALQGELRAVHLAAHLAMTSLLTEHQRHEYPRLRGYGGAHRHRGH